MSFINGQGARQYDTVRSAQGAHKRIRGWQICTSMQARETIKVTPSSVRGDAMSDGLMKPGFRNTGHGKHGWCSTAQPGGARLNEGILSHCGGAGAARQPLAPGPLPGPLLPRY